MCEGEWLPVLKNLDDFRRIIRYLKVMSDATYYHKYCLAVGFKGIGQNVGIVAKNRDDMPAMAGSGLSICF